MKKIILTIFLSIQLIASQTFIMPEDKKDALNAIISSINSAESDIFLAMYNFSYKKIAKELVKASKREVSVTVLFEYDKLIKDRTILDFLKNNGVNVISIKDKQKMHLKAMLIDEKLAIIGSINYTKKSFESNSDLVFISSDESLVLKLKELRAKFK